MTLAELAEALGLPPRQVRYLIAEGVIPPARTLGRGGDAFGEIHVAAGRAFTALAAEGHGVRKAKAILEARAMVAAMVVDAADGERRDLRFGPVAVSVDPADLARLSDLQFDAVMAAIRDKLLALRADRDPADERARPRAATRRAKP